MMTSTSGKPYGDMDDAISYLGKCDKMTMHPLHPVKYLNDIEDLKSIFLDIEKFKENSEEEDIGLDG